MRKHFLKLSAVAIVLLFIIIPHTTSAFAEMNNQIFALTPLAQIKTAAASGEHLENNSHDYTYTVLDDGTVEITHYSGAEIDLIIPATLDGCKVTKIGEYAFDSCPDLRTVTFPKSITEIGYAAFYRCIGIRSVKFSEGLVRVGDYAFEECEKLTSLDFPESLTSIGEGAFNMCTSLRSITIPENVTDVGFGAFYNCPELTTAGPIGSGYRYQYGWKTSIPDNAFSGTGISNIVFPEEVTSIGKNAFSDCFSLSDIEIPAGVTSVEDFLFAGCAALTHVTIPESMIRIGTGAFNQCVSLADLVIHDGVAEIGEYAFNNCEALANLSIPASVTSIGSDAFQDCDDLKLAVVQGSYAEQYCIANNLPYTGMNRQIMENGQEQYQNIVGFPWGGACALRQDGTVQAVNMGEEADEIEQWRDITKIVPLYNGGNTIGGIREDGTVIIAGRDKFQQCYGFDEYQSWTDIVDLADIGIKLFGLKSDGTVVATGGDQFAEEWDNLQNFDVSDWKNIRKICGTANDNADFCLFGLDEKGTLYYAGASYFVPKNWDGLHDVVDIDCSGYVYLVVKKDGTVSIGGLDSGSIADEVESWKDIVQVCAGSSSTVGLRKDGTVVTAGFRYTPDLSDWQNIQSIYKDAANNIYGICKDGTVRCYAPKDEYENGYEGSTVNQSLVESWTGIEKVIGIYDNEAKEMVVVGLRHDGTIVCTQELSSYND